MTVQTDILQQFDLFAGLTDSELASVVPLCQTQDFLDGTVIFREDDEANVLYLITRGKVSLYLEKQIQLKPHGTLRKATIEVLNAGRVLGWSALVKPYRYALSAVCLEPSTLIAIDAPGLRELLKRDHLMGHVIMERLARIVKTRLKDTTHTLTYFLLSIVCHELKAPLAAVENYLNLMLAGYTGDITEQQRQILERSCIRLVEMSDLIGGLLDLAYMQPEQIRGDFELVSPHEIVTLSLEDIHMAADQKQIQSVVDVPDDLSEIVGAPKRLRQAFTNLLNNAIKLSPEGGTITLRIREEEEALQAEVIGTGPRISPQDLPHIFEDFYRAADVQAPALGLGLSIVKRIVDAHAGQIWAESPYPPDGTGGTRFVVRLPRDPRKAMAGSGAIEAHDSSVRNWTYEERK